MQASIRKVTALEERWAISNSAKPAIASFKFMCGCMNSFYPDAAPPAGLVNHLATLLEREIQPRIASLARRQQESDDEFVSLAQVRKTPSWPRSGANFSTS
jgi:hypothetical protein